MQSLVRIVAFSLLIRPALTSLETIDDKGKDGQGLAHAHLIGQDAAALLLGLDSAFVFRNCVIKPAAESEGFLLCTSVGRQGKPTILVHLLSWASRACTFRQIYHSRVVA